MLRYVLQRIVTAAVTAGWVAASVKYVDDAVSSLRASLGGAEDSRSCSASEMRGSPYGRFARCRGSSHGCQHAHSLAPSRVSGTTALICTACSGSTPVTPKPPTWDAGGQAKCRIAKNASEPLIVEWPSADRAKLEALARGGVVAVHYSGCEIKVLGQCSAPGTYRYVGTTVKHDVESIRSNDELYAKLPLGAARLEGTLARSGSLHVTMSTVGRYAATDPVVQTKDLKGVCEGATHLVAGLIVGAFSFEAGAGGSVAADVSAFGGEAGGKSQVERSVLSSDGLEAACQTATTDAEGPPAGCAAMLKIELTALREPPEVAARREEEERQKEAAVVRDREGRQGGRTAGWIVGIGLGGALLATAGITHFLHYDTERSIEAGGFASGKEIESAQSTSKTLNVLTYVFGGLGVGLVALGTLLIVSNGEPDEARAARVEKPRPLPPRLMAGPNGVGVEVVLP